MRTSLLHWASIALATAYIGCASDESNEPLRADNELDGGAMSQPQGQSATKSEVAPTHQNSAEQSTQRYAICDQSMTVTELEQLLQGLLFIAAGHRQYGLTPTEAAVGFALTLVENGIDFGALGTGAPDFVDGAYVFRNGDAIIGLRFVLTKDVGTWKSGTVINHDLFTPENFFSGLRLAAHANWSLTHPSIDADIEFVPGPLFDLVEGDIQFDGIVPTKASLRLRTDAIGVEIVTRQSYSFVAPHQNDELDIVVNSTPVPLDALKSALAGEGLGLNMAETQFHSESYQLEQHFSRATFMLGKLGESKSERWFISGPYEAELKTKGLPLFQLGWAHTIEGNWAELYCDAAHTEFVGRADHNLDLSGGTFKLADGVTFDYRLQATPSIDDRVRP